MTTKQFRQYKVEAILRFRRILDSAEPSTFDEQALPAYTNPNPLMRWVFWERVKRVMKLLDGLEKNSLVVDFGCGFGVMLPYLNARAGRVFAVDNKMVGVGEELRSSGWRKVTFHQDLAELRPNLSSKIDMILALDVLEHIADRESVLREMASLLEPSGKLIITGPSESAAYRLGRRWAGYSGDYHEVSVHDVFREVREHFDLNVEPAVFPLLPLFLIGVASTKGARSETV